MMTTIVVVLAVALAFAIVVGLWLFLALRNAPERRLKRRVERKAQGTKLLWRTQLDRRTQGAYRTNAIPRFEPPDEERTMLTVAQAQRIYGVNGRTLRRWLQQRKIAGWKDGRMWMIDRRSLEKYLKERWR